MKTSKNSFTSRVVRIFNKDRVMPRDLCEYWRAFLLNLATIAATCTLIGTYLGHFVASIAVFFATGFVTDFLDINVFIFTLMGVSALIFFIVWLLVGLYSNTNIQIPIPSILYLIPAKYRAWKEKYCPIMEYTD